MTRKYLTPKERQAMHASQDGLCSVCGLEITVLGCIAEHWVTVESGNDQKPDCLLCIPCAKRKTFGTKATSYGSDAHERAKVKRLRGETKTGPKKAIPKHPFPPKPEGYVYRWNNAKTFLGGNRG